MMSRLSPVHIVRFCQLGSVGHPLPMSNPTEMTALASRQSVSPSSLPGYSSFALCSGSSFCPGLSMVLDRYAKTISTATASAPSRYARLANCQIPRLSASTSLVIDLEPHQRHSVRLRPYECNVAAAAAIAARTSSAAISRVPAIAAIARFPSTSNARAAASAWPAAAPSGSVSRALQQYCFLYVL